MPKHEKTGIISTTYLYKYSAKESEDDEYVIVRGQGIGHAQNDQCPMAEQNDRFTSERVRQSGADEGAEHHSDDGYCLCEVLEICPITDQIPLQTYPQYCWFLAIVFYRFTEYRLSGYYFYFYYYYYYYLLVLLMPSVVKIPEG